MILKYFSVLHLLVCCHIFMGYNLHPSWLFSMKEKYNLNNYLSIYICSFYFLITTLTTVGYGDIVCVSLTERIFQIMELSLGIILYSYIVSKLGDIIKRDSYAKIVYQNNLAILEDIRVTYPKMPYKLYNKILNHLQKNIRQQKKTNLNLLINNLPHMLKHTLLFIIHKNYITNFYFFKKCYNSNFITYSLINFIPLSSKKNSLLLKEDQLIDNVIFITEGRLSLEIAIELEDPFNSIKKYLSKSYNPLKSGNTINEKFSGSKNTDKSDLNFKENEIERDFDESNYDFLNISNIFKNENYGEVFIIFNKPSPLFLRVKSKIANLFLLNKKHILYLASTYSNIWNRLFKKSLRNMMALKNRTIEIVKKQSFRYNINNISKIQNEESNKSNNIEIESKKIEKVSGDLKIILQNNIKNVKSHRYSIASCPKIGVEQITKSKKFKTEEIDEKNNIENKNEESEHKVIKRTNKKNSDEIVIKKEEFRKVKSFLSERKNSENHMNKTNNKSTRSNNSLKSFNTIGSKVRRSRYYSNKIFDKIYIRKLEMKLKKEQKERKYYQKLYNELLNKSINFTNMANNELNSMNTNFSNFILKDINKNNGINQLQKRSLSVKYKDDKRTSFKSLTPKNSIKQFSKSKTKKLTRVKSKFNLGKSKSITKNCINIIKDIDNPNKEQKVEKLKISNDKINFNFSNKNNKLYIKEKTYDKKKINKNDIQCLSSFNSDNSRNSLFSIKLMEKKEITKTNESFSKKKNESEKLINI